MSRLRVRLRLPAILVLLGAAIGCSSGGRPGVEPPRSMALPPGEDAAFGWMEADLAERHGPDVSGFALLRENGAALKRRLAIVDAAQETLDLQYYLWHGDDAGRVLLSHVLDAVDRGVFVRLLVDDIKTMGQDATLEALDRLPNVELRIFNPWQAGTRSSFTRAFGFMGDGKRLNRRMHNKLLIADSQVAIVGGRNIGDEYFGLNHVYNFHDIDLLVVGPGARQVEEIFDHFFNSSWVVPAEELEADPSPEEMAELKARLERRLAESDVLEDFPLHATDAGADMKALYESLKPGTSRPIYDRVSAEGGAPGQQGLLSVLEVLESAEEQALIENAYVVAGPRSEDLLDHLQAKGVEVQLLTNSLASYNVPFVHSAYKKDRDLYLDRGVRLFELRSDAELKEWQDTEPVHSRFLGLHAKWFVVDRRQVFVGSLNFDPRSVNLNTEMGLLVDSAELGAEAADAFALDASGVNSWEVKRDDRDELIWVSSDETLQRAPARGFFQRFLDWFFGILPMRKQL